MRGIQLLTLSFFCVSFVFGQTEPKENPILLKTLNISASRVADFAVGATIIRIDSIDMRINRQNSLSDLLRSSSNMIITSYGVGGLSSISLRGGGTSHTAVVWNGLNIQSPMSSGVNLAVFPVSLFDNVKIQSGGSGTLFGSGAVSGVVHISSENMILQDNNIALSYNKGSFGDNSGSISIKQGGKKFASSIKAYYQKADNDFTFENKAKYKSPMETQSHANVTQYSAIEENQIRFSDHSFLNTALLYSHFDKDLQTQMIQSESKANQQDNNVMGSLNWKYIQPKYTLSAKSGYIYNQILYEDKSYSSSTTDNHSITFVNEIESRIKIFKEQLLNIGVNHTLDNGFSDAYLGKIQRSRLSIFSSYKLKGIRERLSLVLSGRTEFVKERKPVLVYSIGSDFAISKAILAKANISKNYRTPGFNDLYWSQGHYAQGNINLKPETGWSAEAGFEEGFVKKRLSVNTSQMVFYTYINNWIVWLPDEANVWTPENKETGKTYGAEINVKSSYHWNKAAVILNSQYTWTHSRIFSADAYNERPMIYVPEHSLMASLTVNYKRLYVRYNLNYYSERFYDYKHSLEPYQLADLVFGYEKPIKNTVTALNFKVLNIWNTDYQVMAWYAMPRCHYMITLTMNILTKKQ